MNWFLIALLPPALWSVTNYFDKYLLSKYFKGGGVGALMVFSAIIGLFLLPFIVFLHPEVLIFTPNSFWIAINGFLFILAVLPYFYALNKDDASVAVPLFQLIPVFSYVLAFVVLGETLNNHQIFGGIFVVVGAIGISLDLSVARKVGFKKDVFWLMMLSSLIYSLNFLFFKMFALESDFWFTSFWEYVGFAIFATILMLFVKPYRKQFLEVLKNNKMTVLGLNGINEVINIFAKIAFNVASLLAPITLIWIVNGLQPFFIFIYGILLTLFFPKIIKEDISRKTLAQKIVAIIVIFIGAILVNKS